MRKLIAAINMTLDGFCDHTAGIPDDELMEHYNELFRGADTEIFGRTTYQLMESYWPEIAQKQNDDKLSNEFAVLIDDIPKIVYSRTLQTVDWKNTELKHELVAEDIIKLKQQPGKNILVGSPSLIVQLTGLGLIDEYQLCVHPVILGSGLPLFKNLTERVDLKLLKSKTHDSGVILLHYEPAKQT
jgi:dihydrofolate reductase